MFAPSISMLLTVSLPKRWVTVCAPATLMVTSSFVPGRSGFGPQFVTMSQKLVPPIQLTGAACDGTAGSAATAASEASSERRNELRMAPSPRAASDAPAVARR